jgi:hypothetical protein
MNLLYNIKNNVGLNLNSYNNKKTQRSIMNQTQFLFYFILEKLSQ